MVKVLENKCPICRRPLPDDSSVVDEHHLIPKSKGGKEKIRLHRICHNKLHSLWTEKELALNYNTIERIIVNTDMRKFIKWVRNKSPHFLVRSKDNTIRKRKRKRR